jgi:hypothetical protein
MALTIWTNGVFTPAATQLLHEGTKAHRLITARTASASVLVAGQPDPELAQADIAFGQPDPADCLRNPGIMRRQNFSKASVRVARRLRTLPKSSPIRARSM